MTTRKLVAWAIRMEGGSLHGSSGYPFIYPTQRAARAGRLYAGGRKGRVVRVTIQWLA